MYYLIYKTTNLLNGKFYIGKHQTSNLEDGYVGSGKLLKYAIKKYGAENFVTEILEVYDQEWKMNLAEKILVVIDPMSYNLCSGGKGGFGYLNNNSLNKSEKQKIAAANQLQKNLNILSEKRKDINWKTDYISKVSDGIRKSYANGRKNGFQGRKHSEETKAKMRAARKNKTRL